MLVLVCLLLPGLGCPRLVLDSWSDLYTEDGEVDVDRLVTEADLVTVRTEPYEECPQMEIEVQEYEVFLMVNGVEVRDTLERSQMIDLWNTTRTIMSEKEPWIKGAIELR